MNGEKVILYCALTCSAFSLALMLWLAPSLRPAGWKLDNPQPKFVAFLAAIWILLSGAFMVVGTESVSAIVRSHIRSEIDKALQSNPSVSVDGMSLSQADAKTVLSALSSLQFVAAHHSHTIDSRTVSVTANSNSLFLRLSKDSERSSEFWVYWPSFSETLSIGRVNSASLASVLK